MRELNRHEIETVSGGLTWMGIAFILSIISGVKGFNKPKTIMNCALLGSVIGAINTGPLFLIGMPVGALIGAVDGFAGYTIGSFFQD